MWESGDTVSRDPPEASATDVISRSENSLHMAGVSGEWRVGTHIKGATVSQAAPDPDAVTFTSSNGGTTPYTGISSSLSSRRTWTIEAGPSSVGPWTVLGTYEDFDASSAQDGATPWVTGKPVLDEGIHYKGQGALQCIQRRAA